MVPQAPIANMSVAEAAQIPVQNGLLQEGIAGSCSAVHVNAFAARLTVAVNVRGEPSKKAVARAACCPIVAPRTQAVVASPRASVRVDSGKTEPSPTVQTTRTPATPPAAPVTARTRSGTGSVSPTIATWASPATEV